MKFSRALKLFLLADALATIALAFCNCSGSRLSTDTRDGLQHYVNTNVMALRYIDAASPPGMLIFAGACGVRGVLAREGAPMSLEAGPVGCPQ